MTTHELARKLLAGPDGPVFARDQFGVYEMPVTEVHVTEENGITYLDVEVGEEIDS